MRNCFIDIEHNAIADLVNGRDQNVMILTRINVPKKHRGKGVARKLLQEILDEADREDIVIKLEILSSGGLSWKQLESWYKRKGFKWSGTVGDFGFMIRQPIRGK